MFNVEKDCLTSSLFLSDAITLCTTASGVQAPRFHQHVKLSALFSWSETVAVSLTTTTCDQWRAVQDDANGLLVLPWGHGGCWWADVIVPLRLQSLLDTVKVPPVKTH